jgi:sugar/nucleoside kinase (ribokinase family)
MDEEFPVKEVHVKDVSGAGDTFMTGLVYEYMNSKDIRKAINFAQKCSINVVQKHGVAAVSAKEVIRNFKS